MFENCSRVSFLIDKQKDLATTTNIILLILKKERMEEEIAPTTTLLRATGRSLYVYESYHGFLFFLSTLVFVFFWYAIFKYYSNHTYPLTATGGQQRTSYISQFSSRSPPAKQVTTVVSTTTIPLTSRPQTTKPQNGFQQPIAAYVVDDYGRKSMIPTATAVEYPSVRTTAGPISNNNTSSPY